VLDRARLTADHQAVASLEAPHPTAGADVEVVDTACGQRAGAVDVIPVVAVTTIDDDVVGIEVLGELIDDLAGQRSAPSES
jgi:hypothetical protein